MPFHSLMAVSISFEFEGYSLPPSIPVVGAYFPDWLVCMAVGPLLAAVLRAVLIRCRAEAALGPPTLVYPTLALLFSLLTWLVLFK